jgi:hypothetical protein
VATCATASRSAPVSPPDCVWPNAPLHYFEQEREKLQGIVLFIRKAGSQESILIKISIIRNLSFPGFMAS